MSDIRAAIERQLQSVKVRPFTLENFYRRRRRQQRNQRILAAGVGIAIAAASFTFVTHAFRGSQEPADRITPQNIGHLQLIWTADVPDLGFGPPTSTDGQVLVRSEGNFTDGNVVAYPDPCTEVPCAPAWTGSTGDAVGQPAVGGDRVYVTGADCTPHGGGATCYGRLLAFPSSCPSSDSRCAPAWTSTDVRVGGSEHLIPVTGGVVAGGSFYPASCIPENCHPLWVDRRWDTSQDGILLDDQLVLPEGDRIAAYPVACLPSGACDPLWTSPIGKDAVLWTLGDGVAAFDQGPDLSVATGCSSEREGCSFRWTARVPIQASLAGCTSGSVSQDAGLVFLASGDCAGNQQVQAYPSDCRSDGGSCEPAWTWNAPGGISAMVVADGYAFAVSQDRLWALPGSCSTDCEASWHAEATAMPREPVAGDGLVWVTSGNDLIAYPTDCGPSDTCAPLWREDLGARIGSITIQGSSLFVTAGQQLSVWGVRG